jgi:hypothetical protein
MLTRMPVVGSREEPAERGRHAKDWQRIPRNPLGVDLLGLSAGVVEHGFPHRDVAHAEELNLGPARVAHPLEERVVEVFRVPDVAG